MSWTSKKNHAEILKMHSGKCYTGIMLTYIKKL